jgi:CheY-like chemotaxis protein
MNATLPSILVVDDEPDICRNLVDIFEDLGYRVDMAHDGETALKLVRQQHYDLALLDLMMPGMDGAAVYEGIKRESAGTAALMLTAYPGHPRAETAKASGVWRVLSKPVDFAKLMAVIDSALAQPLILLVDDDEDFCANLWDLLHNNDYRVCLAHSVTEAMQKLAQSHYDVVLVDMVLPDGEGTAIVQQLQDQKLPTRIVGVTAAPERLTAQLQTDGSRGVETVLSKPLDAGALLTTLRLTRPH